MPKFLAPSLMVGDNRLASASGAQSHRLSATAPSSINIGVNTGGTPSVTLSVGNIAIGDSALSAISGNNTGNVAIGYQALQNGTGTYDAVAIGYQALQAYGGNAGAIGIGNSAGKANTTGGVFIGKQAGMNATGATNVIVGFTAGSAVTTGQQNVIMGSGAGPAMTTAGGNLVIGYAAGPSLVSGLNNTTVGNGADVAAAVNNATALGTGAVAGASGSVAIGRDSAGVAVTTAVVNEIKLGTTTHTLNVTGNCSLGGSGKTLGFLGATPVVRNAGWTVTAGYTADKIFDPTATTLNEVAAVLGTLIDALKTYGLLG